MTDQLTIEQKRLIIDAGFDSHRRNLLDLSYSDLLVYLLDDDAFERIFQQVLEHDQQE